MSECEIWAGALRNGRPVAKIDGKTRSVQQYRWQKQGGQGNIRTVCGNDACINVEHFERIRKLSMKEIKAIKRTLAKERRGEPERLAKKYGVSIHTIYKLRTRYDV